VRDSHLVSFDLPSGVASLWARVRVQRQAPSGETHYAFEFEPGQYPARAALTRAIFDGRYPVAGTERRSWSDILVGNLAALSERFVRHPRPERMSRPPAPASSPTAARGVSG